MNSSTSEALWPSPVAAHTTALHIANTQDEFIQDVAAAIIDAVGSGAFTCTVDASAETSVDTQYVVALLNQGGYNAQILAAGLVINW